MCEICALHEWIVMAGTRQAAGNRMYAGSVGMERDGVVLRIGEIEDSRSVSEFLGKKLWDEYGVEATPSPALHRGAAVPVERRFPHYGCTISDGVQKGLLHGRWRGGRYRWHRRGRNARRWRRRQRAGCGWRGGCCRCGVGRRRAFAVPAGRLVPGISAFAHLAAWHGLALVVELVRLVRLLARIGAVIDVVAGLVQIGGRLGLHPGAAHGHQGGGQQKNGGFHGAYSCSH